MTHIDKGIPIPPPASVGRSFKYPWARLDVGDSFFVPDSEAKSLESPKRLMDAGWEFRIASVTEDGVRGRRAWRTK